MRRPPIRSTLLILAGLFAAWLLWPAAIYYVVLPAMARGTLGLFAAVAPIVLGALPLAIRVLLRGRRMVAYWILALAPVTVLANLMGLLLIARAMGAAQPHQPLQPLQWEPVLALAALWLAFGLFAPARIEAPKEAHTLDKEPAKPRQQTRWERRRIARGQTASGTKPTADKTDGGN